jgi:hypothetical protein
MDSQSVKTTGHGQTRGYDAGKMVKGRKRHIVVDTLGLLLLIWVTSASLQDREGGAEKVGILVHILADLHSKNNPIER